MASVFNTSTDKEKEESKTNETVVSGGSNIAGSTSVQSSPQQRSGGDKGFTNLGRYLEANKEQSQEMGGKFTGLLDDKRSAAESQLSGLESQKLSGPARDAGLLSSLRSGRAVDDQGFQQGIGQKYQGPTSKEGSELYNTANQNVEKFKRDVEAMGTFGGVQAAAKQLGGKGYKRGEGILDSFLVTRDPNARQAIESQQQQADVFGNRLSEAGQKFEDMIGQTQQQYQQTQQDYANALQQGRQAVDARAQTQLNDLYFNTGLDKRGLSQEDLAAVQSLSRLGIDTSQFFDRNQNFFGGFDEGLQSDIQSIYGLGGEQARFDNDISGLFNQNVDKLGSARGLSDFDRQQEQERLAINQALQQDYSNRRSGGPEAAGLSREDAARLSEVLGAAELNFGDFYRKGKDYGIGDVVNDQERQQLQSLLGSLGGDRLLDSRYGRTEGAGRHSFDWDALDAALDPTVSVMDFKQTPIQGSRYTGDIKSDYQGVLGEINPFSILNTGDQVMQYRDVDTDALLRELRSRD